MCNVTHKLVVIGQADVMRLLIRKCRMPPTACWSTNKIWLGWDHDCLSEKGVTHSLLSIGQDVMRLQFRHLYNVTHMLLVMVQDVRLCFMKNCNVTHTLVGILGWEDCLAEGHKMPPTCCWPWDKMWWDCISDIYPISLTCCWSWKPSDETP